MKRLVWTLFYLFVFSLLVYNSFSYLDPDFGWHLRFGEIIWQTKEIPHDQLFTWTLEGKTWVDHEWLGNLGLFGLWSLGGYAAVTLAFVLLPLAAIALINHHLFRFYLKKIEARFIVAALEIGVVFFALPHFGVRLQELTFLFLCITVILLDRFSIDRKSARLWWLVPLFYMWASSHAGFLIGLFVCALWLIYEYGLALFPRLAKFITRSPLDKKTLLRLTLICGAAFVVTLVTPYGFELYNFLGDYRETYYMSYIQEWRPPYAYPLHYGQLLFNFLAVVSTIATLFLLRKYKLLFNCLFTLIFSIMAFRSVRHFPLLIVGWLLLIIPHFLPELTERLYIRARSVFFITAACLGMLSTILLVNSRFTTDPFNAYCKAYPCAALSFLREHPQYLYKLYNHYNFGGFMIGALPEARLFIDGRLPQFPLAGVTLLEEYNNFNSDQAAKKLHEYDIKTVFYNQPAPAPHFNWFERYFLGYSQKNYENQSNPLIEYVKKQPDWKNVYEDSLSSIYVKQ